MATVNLQKYKKLFDDTAREYEIALQKNLRSLSKSPSSHSALTGLHISAHSLKAQSLAMGYTKTGELLSAIEKACADSLDKKEPVSQVLLSKISEAVDTLSVSLASIRETGKESVLGTITL